MSELTEARGLDYGPPWEHHAKTAALINVLLPDGPMTATRWQVCMIADKLVRFMHTERHIDSLKDIAGYAECALATLDNESDEDFAASILASLDVGYLMGGEQTVNVSERLEGYCCCDKGGCA